MIRGGVYFYTNQSKDMFEGRGRLIFASKSDGRNTHYFPGAFEQARVSGGFHYRSRYP
jgi:hypothetical protein